MELKKIKVSEKKQEILKNMNIHNVEDLLTYYPHRYEIWELKKKNEWQLEEKVIFEGIIVNSASVIRLKGKQSMTRFKVNYDDDIIDITLFNRPWSYQFPKGKKIVIMGQYKGNDRVTCLKYHFNDLKESLGMNPVYHLKEGMNQKDLMKYIDKAYEVCNEELEDFIPIELINKYQLISRKEALYFIHHPMNKDTLKQSLRHLKYEEFFKFQLCMQYMKLESKSSKYKKSKQFDIERVWDLKRALSFELSEDQIKVIDDILNDLRSDEMMYRMVQGDVGCGKTIVACFAMYACVLSHKQAALLAPTEILAKQHLNSFLKLFKDFNLNIECLYSSMKNVDKQGLLERLKNNEIDILIGTHALFQESVEFYDLGLVVADEHHRFGVNQRKQMLAKGNQVDFMLMSATPIPRTLAISLYGDMDVSTIHTLPKNRLPIITKYYQTTSMKVILEFILKQIDEGRQCYVVCPAIENNEEYQMRNVKDIYEGMKQTLGKKYSIGLLHGDLTSQEKDQVMNDFALNKIQILVSTTVIEVGVDVSNANMMVIYDAHRFGLSQIHQLRGRIGRGQHQGYCFLLSNIQDIDSKKRLEILQSCNDGFELSKYDLALRGPGDILGTRQSGVPGFVLGNVVSDQTILDISKQDAYNILLNLEKYPKIKQFIEERIASMQYLD